MGWGKLPPHREAKGTAGSIQLYMQQMVNYQIIIHMILRSVPRLCLYPDQRNIPQKNGKGDLF